MSIVANNEVKGHVVDLTCSYEDPTNKPVTRAPQAMPVVSIDGNTLFFNHSFFEDIATVNEIKSLAQRIQVAKLLSEKKTYTDIAEITGASTATISRVNRSLNYGSHGYKTILERLKEN